MHTSSWTRKAACLADADLPDLHIQGPGILTWTIFLVLVQKKEYGRGVRRGCGWLYSTRCELCGLGQEPGRCVHLCVFTCMETSLTELLEMCRGVIF